MDLFFADAQLATLCNSKQQITSLWGAEGFAAVSRRLTELCAVDGVDVVNLPMITITPGDNCIVTIEFDLGGVTITAIPLDTKEPTNDITKATELQIMTVNFDHRS